MLSHTSISLFVLIQTQFIPSSHASVWPPTVTLLLPQKDSFSQLSLTVPLVLTQLFLLFTLSKFDAYNVYVVVTTLIVTLAT
jgi:hypothetical protein